MRKTVADLGLKGIEVVHSRLESLMGLEEHRSAYDGFTSRATTTLVPTLKLAAEVVAPGGFSFLWKGGRREREMAEDESWTRNWEMEALMGIGGGLVAVAMFKRK